MSKYITEISNSLTNNGMSGKFSVENEIIHIKNQGNHNFTCDVKITVSKKNIIMTFAVKEFIVKSLAKTAVELPTLGVDYTYIEYDEYRDVYIIWFYLPLDAAVMSSEVVENSIKAITYLYENYLERRNNTYDKNTDTKKN